jgi:colanic acid biosynthesis glycosyl transferase WcaI
VTEGPIPTGSGRRILLYGLNFAPESTGIGKYTGELAQWLARAGHEVRVVTAPPYYPSWRVRPGYRDWFYKREIWNGLCVYRAPLWVPRSPSGGKRLLHLASFAISSFPLLLQSFFWRPHLLFCVAPGLACAPGAALIARLSGARSWLHIQDFEVDAAFELGMLRGKKMRAAALRTERAVLRSFDRVSSISGRMVEKLREKGVTSEKALLLPNWVDTDVIQPMPLGNSYRQELGIPDSAFVALYSGTMGAKQGLEVLGEAAQHLADRANIHFVFCGQGPGRDTLQRACSDVPRVHWLPLQPAERLSELLSTANVHLLPQRCAAADLMLPSKLSGMLASGRPVLATAEAGTELAGWIDGCGEIVLPGDAAALAQSLLALHQDPQWCHEMGARARRRALERLSLSDVMEVFRNDLESALLGCVRSIDAVQLAVQAKGPRPD